MGEKFDRRDYEMKKQLNQLTERVSLMERNDVAPRERSVTFVDSPAEDELFQTLDKIEQMVKANRAGPVSPHRKPVVRPQKFEGTGSWEDYSAQFQLIADLNGWDDVTKATHLAVSLAGAARAVLGDLPEGERKDYESLNKAVRARFGTDNLTEVYRTQIKSGARGKDESLPELAQAFRRLSRLAYPDASPDLRETLARDFFIDALGDADTRWRVRQNRPSTLNKALEIAVELEAFFAADKQRGRQLRTVQTQPAPEPRQLEVNAVHDELRKEMEELKGLVRQMATPNRLYNAG